MTLRRRSYWTEAVKAKKGKFQKAIGQGFGKEPVMKEVSGYIVGHIGIDKQHSTWVVTHIPSGKSIGPGYRTLKVAKLFAEGMASIIPKDKEPRLTPQMGTYAADYRNYLEGGGTLPFKEWKKKGNA